MNTTTITKRKIKNALAEGIKEAENLSAVLEPISALPLPDKDFDEIITKSPNPNMLTQGRVEALRTAYSAGFDDTQAASFAKMSISTLHTLIKTNPKLKEHIEVWKIVPMKKALDVIVGSLNSDNERIRTDSAKFLLEKLNPNFSPAKAKTSSSTDLTANKAQLPRTLTPAEAKQFASLIQLNISFSQPEQPKIEPEPPLDV